MDILSRTFLEADYRIPYGDDASQFGDLWLPSSGKPHPLVVFFHGGWWKSEYGLGYTGHLCAALRSAGMAVWSVEYRRVGSTGGGWPITFQDAAAGFNAILELDEAYPLDLSRVIAAGHSAGGLLAFWIASRDRNTLCSDIGASRRRVPLRAVISLAGAVDLKLTIELAKGPIFAHGREEVYRLMGGSAEEVPERYEAGNPGDLLPLQAPQILLQGSEDDQIPPDLPHRWGAMSPKNGPPVAITIIPGADHFDVVDPDSKAWETVIHQIRGAFRQ